MFTKNNVPIDFSRKMTYLYSLSLPFRITPFLTAAIISLEILKIAIIPINVYATAHFIDGVLQSSDFSSFLNWESVLVYLMLMVFCKLFHYISIPITNLIDRKRSQKNWEALNSDLLATYAGLELKHIENDETMDLIVRVLSNAPEVSLISNWETFQSFVFSISTIISYITPLLIGAPFAGIVIIVASIPVAFLSKKYGKEQYTVEKDTTGDKRVLEGMNYYLRNRETVSERNLFHYTSNINKRYHSILSNIHSKQQDVRKKNVRRKNKSQIALSFIAALSLTMLLIPLSKGTISVGMYISLIAIVFEATSYITNDLSSFTERFVINKEYLKDFNNYISLSKEIGSLDEMSTEPIDFEGLEFRNVSFKYPGTEKKILNNLSFKIEPGKNYSLIGINGSGKTTITKLILRLYNDYEGEILLNGKSLKDWPLSTIKSLFSAVFQDYIEYDISLEDNISVGAGLNAQKSEIINAIDVVGLKECVDSLPNGMSTMLGKIYDDGVDLSQGQWQKIAIARTIVSSAKLKILDEPTASLDPLAEKEIYENFDKIRKGSATIFISHRLASAKTADKILVLDNGTIVESGTHEYLINKKGIYFHMYESQKRWYS